MGTQVTISASQVDKERLGYCAISLTHFTDTAEPSIAAGSKVEIGGALYEFTADEAGTGFAGIGASNNAYILLTPAGASVSWSYTTTAPTWDTAKQGWYTGSNRVVAGLYKDSGGLYTAKYIMPGNIGAAGKNMVVFTAGAGSTWKCPYTGYYKVTAVGGGGGGGGSADATESVGSGGGGGATAIKAYWMVAGATFTYTVGALGAGGGGGAGAAGGDTTVSDGTTTITGGGGAGGTAGTTLARMGAAGGVATNGGVNIPGQTGGQAHMDGTSPYYPLMGGNGGGSTHGAGGIGPTRTTAGQSAGAAGAGYGGGGSGTACKTAGANGGNGTAGVIIIEY